MKFKGYILQELGRIKIPQVILDDMKLHRGDKILIEYDKYKIIIRKGEK